MTLLVLPESTNLTMVIQVISLSELLKILLMVVLIFHRNTLTEGKICLHLKLMMKLV